jgi:hypothetical protein
VDIQSGSCSSDADRCVCSSDGCNKPSDLELSDSPENNCSYALKDYPVPLLETPAPAPPPVINNYITVIVIIIQFRAPYTMSELTPDIQNKIATAVANVIGLNASSVSLTFVEVDLRRRTLLQQKGVLVNVGLKDVQGSTTPYASRLTQDSINSQMAILGLRSVSSVQAVTNSTQAVSSIKTNRAVRMLPCSMMAFCFVLAMLHLV